MRYSLSRHGRASNSASVRSRGLGSHGGEQADRWQRARLSPYPEKAPASACSRAAATAASPASSPGQGRRSCRCAGVRQCGSVWIFLDGQGSSGHVRLRVDRRVFLHRTRRARHRKASTGVARERAAQVRTTRVLACQGNVIRRRAWGGSRLLAAGTRGLVETSVVCFRLESHLIARPRPRLVPA